MRIVPEEVLQNCVSLQRNVIQENITSGFSSQAALKVDEERIRYRKSSRYYITQKLIHGGGVFVGFMITMLMLIVRFIRRPEIVLEVLTGKYSRADLSNFFKSWFSMLIPKGGVADAGEGSSGELDPLRSVDEQA